MTDNLKRAIGILKDYRKGDFVGDDEFCEAIDTVVSAVEKPVPTDVEIIERANEHIMEMRLFHIFKELVLLSGQSGYVI